MEKNLTDLAEEALTQITSAIESARIDASNARIDFLKANIVRFQRADLESLHRDFPRRFAAEGASISELLAPMGLNAESLPAVGYVVWHCCVAVASRHLGLADEESMLAFPLEPDGRGEFDEASTLVANWPDDRRLIEVSLLLDESPDVMVAADTVAALLQFDTTRLQIAQIGDLRFIGDVELAELKLD